jgi:predicted membrane GTPase involved in stress response
VSSEFPLEQLVQLTSTRFQEGFARQVIREVAHLRPFRDHVTLAATEEGLRMFGENEEALARPLEALRDVYRGELRASAPQVRYLSRNRQRYEPIMALRVRVAERDLPALHADLAERDVNVLEEDFSRGECVVRAEAPLRKLLGYGAALARLTGGSGQFWCWLDRYAPADDPSGPVPA